MVRRFTLLLLVLCVGLSGVQVDAYEGTSENVAFLQKLSDGVAEVAAQVTPGVVAILSEKTVKVSMQDPFKGTPFEGFSPHRNMPQREREYRQDGQGSGVIVRHKGEYYILTNNHVVKGADDIQVQLADDRYFDAEVVGTDSLSDLAVLRIDAQKLPAVTLGDSDGLRVGEMVLAVGNPLGYEHSVTYGIVSALGRDRFGAEYGSFIQTDAAINPGNSGGALVNLRGELMGINTAIVSRSGGYQGIGFAIPANLVKNVMGQIVEHGEVRRGLLGVKIDNIDYVTAEALGMKNTQGALIYEVVPGRAAEKAGIEEKDVVLAVDGKPVRNDTELRSVIGRTPPGTRVELLILRGGKKKKIAVTLEQLTEEVFAESREPDRADENSLGLELQELTPEIARELGYEGEKGALVSGVRPRSEAARRGLRRGDLIQEVKNRQIEGLDDFEAALDKIEPGEAVLMVVRRGRNTRFVGLKMPAE